MGENSKNLNLGKIEISDVVIESAAGMSASSTSGIAGMSGGLTDGFAQILGKNNFSKGVKLSRTAKDIDLDLYVVVEYGIKIPEVSWHVQENVKKDIENLTGLNVKNVNIHVQGVYFEEKNKSVNS